MVEGLVSIIIPVYNRPKMLGEAVDSVLMQTWRPLEIIIVDDGSTDDTRKAAAELSVRNPETVRVLHQKNAGPGRARQTGFEASRGEFIQFLDSDDLLLPNKFELQVSGLRGDAEAGISYGRTYVRVNGERFPHWSGEKHREIFPALLTKRLWHTSAPLYRRNALVKVGPWPDGRWMEDLEFDAQAGAAKIKLNYCDEYICEAVEHDEPRLCPPRTADAVRDGISAYLAVLGYAQRTGVARNSPEMQQFSKSLFGMALRANNYRLPREAKDVFDLALTLCLKPRWDYRLFGIATSLLGWRTASRIADLVRNARPRIRTLM
jgi:glycosyltransferase involved in cell wall biosynthesis